MLIAQSRQQRFVTAIRRFLQCRDMCCGRSLTEPLRPDRRSPLSSVAETFGHDLCEVTDLRTTGIRPLATICSPFNGCDGQTKRETPLSRLVSTERDGYVANTLRRVERAASATSTCGRYSAAVRVLWPVFDRATSARPQVSHTSSVVETFGRSLCEVGHRRAHNMLLDSTPQASSILRRICPQSHLPWNRVMKYAALLCFKRCFGCFGPALENASLSLVRRKTPVSARLISARASQSGTTRSNQS